MKTYFILGGSSGIGQEVAKQLKNQGHNVITTYNTNSVEQNGIESHHLNVLEPFDLDFLPEQIDGFVYTPGSIDLKPFKRLKSEDILKDVELQIVGFTKALQLILPRLKKSSNPSVVTYSSVAAQNGFNFHSQVGISKGAMEGLVKSLAAELSPTIRINAVAPSLTATPLAEKLINSEAKIKANAERHPLRRIGEASDIAEATCFLLSESSSWITGQIIPVDGGISSIR